MHGSVNHGENIATLRGVGFSYGTEPLLSDVNLAIHRGDYLAIVGGNGSGKTTLLKIMLGLIAPHAGTVELFGTPIARFTAWERIGYVPQKATSFDAGFPATVEQVVLMGRYGRRGLLRPVTREDRAAARRALEAVELADLGERLIGELSGGQQQRAFIARALAGEPEIIFLDEPTVGVEAKVRDEFYALLRRLNAEFHLTIVLVTHDVEAMAHEAMHVACVDRTVFYHDSVDAYFADTHRAAHPHL